jgi:AcrR family transcriptional regulator
MFNKGDAKPAGAPSARGGGRRERKRQQTEDHLSATAFRLFQSLGYEAVTMERIAEEADVAKGTLYKHFPVKEALVAHQFRKEIELGMKNLHEPLKSQPNFAARMRFLLQASAAWTTSHRAYMPQYLRFRWMTMRLGDTRSAPDPYSSGSFLILEKLLREGQAAGELRADLPAWQVAATFEFMLVGASTLWLNHPETDLNDHYQLALEILLRGTLAPPVAAPTPGRAQ